MKRLYFLSICSLVAGIAGLLSFDVDAAPKVVKNSGNAKAVGGNGGNASGKGAKAGNGGSAAAQGGSIFPGNAAKIVNSGNASAKGGNGGNASGKGAKAGNGGDAIAVGGDIGKAPIIGIKTSDIVGKPKVDKIVDPLVKKQPKVEKIVDPLVKKQPKAGGGGGGTAKAGDAEAKGGNGGNASGPGSKGGNGGDAIAVSGNGNTVINGDNNTIIGKVVNNNISLNIGGGGGFGGGFVTGSGAFASGGFGGDGFVQGTPGVAVASSPSETVITTDGSPAVATGANGKDNVEDGEKEQVFTRRFLKVKNDSDVPMKVFVQYRGMSDDKKWAWVPADPNEAQDAIVYDLKPGQEMFLMHKEKKLSASRVRIWGVAESQSWLDYRDQDLWVVPEMDQRGEHRYLATEMRTFTFVFPKQMKNEGK